MPDVPDAADSFFAPPPFKPDDALLTLRRQLREWRLTERDGRFELRGHPVAALTIASGALVARTVAAPCRSPAWSERRLASAADVRDWLTQLKAKLAHWSADDD